MGSEVLLVEEMDGGVQPPPRGIELCDHRQSVAQSV